MATDDDDAATLRERVRDLEATVAQQQDTIEQLMPSRRAILAGGAGLVGGAALTGQASAQSAAGQVGTSSEPVDVEAASVNVQEGVSTPSAFVSGTLTATDVNTDSVNTKRLGRGSEKVLDMSEFPGTSANVRFDNVLSEASGGDTILLETGVDQDKTINKKVKIVGGGVATNFNANLTLTARVMLRDFQINRFSGYTLTVDEPNCAVYGLYFSEIVLTSNSSSCTVVGCVSSDITDNGTNNANAGNS